MADLLRDGNDLTTALPLAIEGLRTLRHYENAPHVLFASLSLAWLRLAQGDTAEAAAMLAEARPLVQHGPCAALAPLLDAGEAQVRLAQGDAADACAWAATAKPVALSSLLHFGTHILATGVEALGVTASRILAVQGLASRDAALLRQAADLLEPAWQLAERQGLGWLRLKALILRALIAEGLGDHNAALAALVAAVAHAEPEEVIRPFVDEGTPMTALLSQVVEHTAPGDSIRRYAERLLAAFPERLEAGSLRLKYTVQASGLKPQVSLLVEPLSNRELEILSLIAQGLTNSEIAQQIFISAQTVKVHARNIYGKLGVNSRRQAVAHARVLGLLP
jgi:ATP/maltotriose-dependent transcriptional regulator MalT